MPTIRYACNGCGVVIDRPGRCMDCGPARKSLTTTQRGYGHDHRVRRQALISNAYGLPCPLCGSLMERGEALDLDHSTPLSVDPHSIGDRIVHASCNRRAGARGVA